MEPEAQIFSERAEPFVESATLHESFDAKARVLVAFERLRAVAHVLESPSRRPAISSSSW